LFSLFCVQTLKEQSASAACRSGAGKTGGITMENKPLLTVQELGQSIWQDYVRRKMIFTGELKKLIDEDAPHGACRCGVDRRETTKACIQVLNYD
jgi:hypothetical protein